jgi:phosphatidylserine synthase
MLSLLSAILAIKKNFYAALIGIVYAGFTERLDGVIARNLM